MMYSEWASLQKEVLAEEKCKSVLHQFPEGVGKDVAGTVVKTLAPTLSVGVQSGEPSSLTTDKEVQWTMEVLCFGLTLPLSEHDTIRDCVNVYCEWLSALTQPKTCVPAPIADDPNPYARTIMQHLHNLFVPRPDAAIDLVNRQAVLCHRVLRVVQTACRPPSVMTADTWHALLMFLLGINDVLLAPPITKNDIGDQLCERVLSVLFELWLLGCSKYFPSPPLWRTFRDMAATWRHHQPLVEQWHRVNVALTSRVISFMYGPDFPKLQVPAEDEGLIPKEMTNDCIAQCWFRLLHIFSNPVDLTHPNIIGHTPQFLHMALTSKTNPDPYQHECLSVLPDIFAKAMRGVSTLVNAFLGTMSHDEDSFDASSGRPGASSLKHSSATPPGQRRAKSLSSDHWVPPGNAKGVGSKGGLQKGQPLPGIVAQSASSSSHSSGAVPSFTLLTLGSKMPLAPTRPKVNSILHLFGHWLIEAAITGVKVHGTAGTDTAGSADGSAPQVDPNLYEVGRAEALAALCRIMASRKTGEEILPVYLSRFYIAVFYGLTTETSQLSGHVLSNMIFSGCDLLRIDLTGVMVLLPQFLRALEFILTDLEPKFRYDERIAVVELRKASIHLLLSMLTLPLHFTNLHIKYLFGEEASKKITPMTFMGLKPRILELLLRALTVETDSNNTQMLLGGLLLCVEDLALFEEAEARAVLLQQQFGMDELTGGKAGQGRESPASADAASSDSASSPRSPRSPRSPTRSISVSLHPSELPHRDVGLRPPPPAGTASMQYIDSAHGLFGHAASLVCNRLMASWKVDLNIALAAIEVLSGLAKVNLSKPNGLMCKRTVNWICELIVYQCSRPAPLHSKDLHSMIVAAFQCLTLWLVGHEYLMYDKECLHCVLEVVELGISGSKSQNRASDTPKLKADKELKPVSQRVRDAAEGLLTVIMDHVGSFPPPCGPESVCSLLDEESLLKYCKPNKESRPDPLAQFRYFVLDGTTIVGLLEQPLGNDQDPLPTVTALIRGPFGRHAWTMQLRHMPRHSKVSSRSYLAEHKRPAYVDIPKKTQTVKHRNFPEIVDKIPKVKADHSIPPLETTMSAQAADLDKLKGFMATQRTFEAGVARRVAEEREKTPYPDPEKECHQPDMCHDFKTARLFLSHYGLLRLEALKDPQAGAIPPSLVMLDSSDQALLSDIEAIDHIPCRTADTVHMFYVKSGQTLPFEILSNVASKEVVNPVWLEFLSSLGWPVDVKKHAGWTGSTETSWKIQATNEKDEQYPADTGGSLYDGEQQVLYWADVTSELAFVVPSPKTYIPAQRRSSADSMPPSEKTSKTDPVGSSLKSDQQAGGLMKPPQPSKSASLDLDHHPVADRPSRLSMQQQPGANTLAPGRRGNLKSAPIHHTNTKVFVVWLESYEDYENFPTADLIPSTTTGLESLGKPDTQPKQPFIIFIHALKNGLFRIKMEAQIGKIQLAIPLVDGMVVSRRSLGAMVRQTAINMCKRKRLENDNYQPPHVRRKQKIKDIVDKYRLRMTEPEFYTAMFLDPAPSKLE